MKLLIFFVLFLVPFIADAQSKADYEQVMRRFIKFYNAGQTDSICQLFPDDEGCFWRQAMERNNASTLDKYGHISLYKCLGVDTSDAEPVHVFSIVFDKAGMKAHSFTLDKQNKYGTFRFITSSDEIERMQKASK